MMFAPASKKSKNTFNRKGCVMHYCPVCQAYWCSEEEAVSCCSFDLYDLLASFDFGDEEICEDCEAVYLFV